MKVNKDNFINEIKKRNPKALDFIIDKYSNLVFKIISNVLNTSFYSDYIEECINDTFWAVWTNIDSFDENKGEFKHWICAISKFKAIDYKRNLFKTSTIDTIENHDYNLSSGDNIEDLFIKKENTKELLSVINTMNVEDREIFIRRYFLDEKIESIANSFGVNRNLVDKRLSRGRKFLKEKLISLKGEILR